MIGESDCLSCHRVDVKSIGPSYIEVAKKYKGDLKGQGIIADRIINGSVGLWGEHAMSAHPNLSKRDAALMIDYIMSLNDPQTAPKTIPLAGNYTPQTPKDARGKGAYLLRAAYTDKGTEKSEAIIDEAIVAFDELIAQVNVRDVEDRKLHLKSVSKALEDKANELVEKLNKL